MKKEALFVESDDAMRAIIFHDYSPAKIDENAHDVIVQILEIISNIAVPYNGGDDE